MDIVDEDNKPYINFTNMAKIAWTPFVALFSISFLYILFLIKLNL